MKSLQWIKADNAALVARADEKRAASIRRLKQRIANAIPWDQALARRNAMAAVDAWAKAEARRSK